MLVNLKIVKRILASTKKDRLQNYFVRKVMDIPQLVSIWETVCKFDVIYRTPNRYNNVITTIVRLSYRKLEYYITKYIQPRLPVISRE